MSSASRSDGSVLVTPSGTLEADCVVDLLRRADIATTAAFHPADTAALVAISVPGQVLSQTLVDLPRPARQLPILLVATALDEEVMRLAELSTAVGVIAWDMGGAAMVEAARNLISGTVDVPDAVMIRPDDPLGMLTPREKDVVSLLVTGKRNDEIADELGISRNTVRTHVGHVLSKLGVNRRHAVVAMSYKLQASASAGPSRQSVQPGLRPG